MTLSDGDKFTTQDITVTVTAVNDAPVASATNATTNEDTAVEITLSASDVDGDSLTYTLVSGPTKGAVIISGTTATYTPDVNWNGIDSFTFNANDGMVNSSAVIVSVTVTAVNDAPVLATIANLILTVKQTVIITPSATDVEVDFITYYINNTNFVWNGTAFNWVTTSSDAGSYWVEVTASDSLLNDTQIVLVTVNPEEVTFTKDLFVGWNLISIPVVVENNSVANVLASIDGNYSTVYLWNATSTGLNMWLVYEFGAPDIVNDFTTLDHTTGFWIYMTANDTLNITGKIPHQTNISIYGNEWNLVGYTLVNNVDPDTAIFGIKNDVDVIWGNFELPSYWESRIPDVSGTMSVMKQGYGYWIKSNNTEDVVLTYTNN